MEFRNLGRSGLVVSEIAYGNWITHGSQVEEDAATACVRAALDLGITTFDTADVYANTRAESVLGRALAGRRREGLEILTKVYWPTGPGADDLARDLHVPLVSNQPQYSLLYRVIEAEVVPTCEELGIGQIVWSPLAQGVLTGKYQPGQAPPAGSRATDQAGGAQFIRHYMRDEVLSTVQGLRPLAEQAGLTPAQLAIAWVLQNPNVAAAIVGATRPEQLTDNVKASGVRLDTDLLKAIDDVVEPIVLRDPALTQSPTDRP